jgi:putative ubiquitin-RnfH superfamily antitoxin RatB of RatAB toxin-antitoxin module
MEASDTLFELGMAQRQIFHNVEAMQSLESALALRKEACGEYHKDVAFLQCEIGCFCHERHKDKEAKEAFQEALKIYQALGLSDMVRKVRRRAADRTVMAQSIWAQYNAQEG